MIAQAMERAGETAAVSQEPARFRDGAILRSLPVQMSRSVLKWKVGVARLEPVGSGVESTRGE